MAIVFSRVDRLAAHQYTFLSDWRLAADLPTAFAVLRDLWSYPRWWPEFKRAEQTADDRGEFALRSALPLTLNFSLVREIDDPDVGILRAIVVGDIDGTIEWRLVQSNSLLTTAYFVQRVTLEHRLARRADVLLRPLLTWNHAVAMRSGYRGMTAYIAAIS
jgi:hypothetical protein